MKKIVGILGMAAVLASAAFAAEPAANFVMTEFKGSYDFGFKADFKNETKGFYNTPDVGIKFGFMTAGDKTTTGDGVWGELKISAKANDPAASIPSPIAKEVAVDTAKIHFVDGDFSLALNIKTPSLEYNHYAPFVATPVAGAFIGYEKDINAKEVKIPAKAIGDNTGLTNGFGLELAMDKLFAANFKLMDNGVSKGKSFGLAFDVALKAVENLDAMVAASFNFDTKYTGVTALAAYKLSIDDKLYVKPGVSYAMNKTDTLKAINEVRAGALFGWGAVDQEPGLDYIPNKTSEGASVAVSFINDDNTKTNTFMLTAGLYDQSLMSLLDLNDMLTLKTGFAYDMINIKADKVTTTQNVIAAALKFDVKLSPIYIASHFGMRTAFGETKTEGVSTTVKSEYKPELKYGVTIGSKEVIDNTDLYVSYEGEYKSSLEKDNVTKNELKIGTKISF